jgi:hypothetical protein
MGTFFLSEAQPQGAIGFQSMAPAPRRVLLIIAACLTGLLAISLLLHGPEQDRGAVLVNVGVLWFVIYVGVPAWNRFIVGPLIRTVLPKRQRDREQFYRFFEAFFMFAQLWILLCELLRVWGIIT